VAEPLVTLASNDFALFGVPAQFAQDRAAIDARWKDLQREAHPDRFAAQGAATQRQAMQWSVRINEAYQRLKDPLRRAAYLCELGGMPIQAESNTAMPAEFLLQQMEWREALDDAQGEADIDALHTEVMAAREQVLAECAQALDVQHDLARAVSLVRALMFLERFGADIEKRYDQLPASPASAATVVTVPGSAG
jgi:molecular chaperone HscB